MYSPFPLPHPLGGIYCVNESVCLARNEQKTRVLKKKEVQIRVHKAVRLSRKLTNHETRTAIPFEIMNINNPQRMIIIIIVIIMLMGRQVATPRKNRKQKKQCRK